MRSAVAIGSDVGQALIANRADIAFVGLTVDGHAVHVNRASLAPSSLNCENQRKEAKWGITQPVKP